MFTWILSWFPYLNFSTFIFINTLVIIANATTIFIIKYKGINFWFKASKDSKETSPSKKKSSTKSKNKSPLKYKKHSHRKQRNNAVDQRLPKQHDSGDQWGRCKNIIKNEGDESINTTLDEITWVSSYDDGDDPYRDGKLTPSGQRQHRSPQQKWKRLNSGGQIPGYTKQPRRVVAPLEERERHDSFRPPQYEQNANERKSQHILCTFHPLQDNDDPREARKHDAENSTSPQRNKFCKADTFDPLSQYSKQNIRPHGDSFEKSPKEKPPTPKSTQSSGWSSNMSSTKCDLCAGEYPSLSSDHLIGSNKSEVSTNLNRDSWIWFSSQFPTNAGNFAARQDRFRSTDPRVPKLLAEITRQDKMNEDIKREANSLIVSESTKSSADDEIIEICQVDSYEENVPMCPLMRRRGAPSKSLQDVDMGDCTTGKKISTKQARKSKTDSLSCTTQILSSSCSKHQLIRKTADRFQRGTPAYRPRVQFISPVKPTTHKKKIDCEISPQNFSSIKYNHHINQESPRIPRSPRIPTSQRNIRSPMSPSIPMSPMSQRNTRNAMSQKSPRSTRSAMSQRSPMSPMSPSIPMRQRSPRSPMSPSIPMSPRSPMNPSRPMRPRSPTSQRSPMSPMSPSIPMRQRSPRSPMNPSRPMRPRSPTSQRSPMSPSIPRSPMSPRSQRSPRSTRSPMSPRSPRSPFSQRSLRRESSPQRENVPPLDKADDETHDLKPSISCLFPTIKKHRSTSPTRREIRAHRSQQDKKDISRGMTRAQEKEDPLEDCHPTVQNREESESDSLFVVSTSLDTYGDKTHQIGQEVSRAIKNIIFNTDSQSSTSNSKTGSSVKSKSQKRPKDAQLKGSSPSNRKRKGETSTSKSSSSNRKHDRKNSPCDKMNSSRTKGKRKYVFGTDYYLSTRSQSQLRLSSSRSCSSNDLANKVGKNGAHKTQESRSTLLADFPSP